VTKKRLKKSFRKHGNKNRCKSLVEKGVIAGGEGSQAAAAAEAGTKEPAKATEQEKTPAATTPPAPAKPE
jgi:hypothetical protein